MQRLNSKLIPTILLPLMLLPEYDMFVIYSMENLVSMRIPIPARKWLALGFGLVLIPLYNQLGNINEILTHFSPPDFC